MSSYVETDLHVYPEGDDTGALPAVHGILWDTEIDSSTLRALDRPPALCLHDDLQTSHTFASDTHNLTLSIPLMLLPSLSSSSCPSHYSSDWRTKRAGCDVNTPHPLEYSSSTVLNKHPHTLTLFRKNDLYTC